MQANVDHVSAVCEWNVKRISASAIVQLARILGSHPSDPGSSPSGGILLQNVLAVWSLWW